MKRFPYRLTGALCLLLSSFSLLNAQFIGFTGRNGFAPAASEQAFSAHFDHLSSGNRMILGGDADDANIELGTRDAMLTVLDACFEPDQTVLYGLPADNERFNCVRPYLNSTALGSGYLAVGEKLTSTGDVEGIIVLINDLLGVVDAFEIAGPGQTRLASCEPIADGGFVVVGTWTNNQGNLDALVMKFDAAFTLDWSVLAGRKEGDDEASSVIEGVDGSIWVCGRTETMGVAGGSDALLFNLNATTGALTSVGGTPNLFAMGTGTDEFALDLVQNPVNGRIGMTGSFLNGADNDILFILFTPAVLGTPASSVLRSIGDPGFERGRSIELIDPTATNPEGFIIAGQQNTTGSGGINGFTLTLDALGFPVSGKHFGGADVDFFMEVDKHPMTNSYVVGGGSKSMTGVMAPDHVFWLDTDAALSLSCPIDPSYEPTCTNRENGMGTNPFMRPGPAPAPWDPNNTTINFITVFPSTCASACKKGKTIEAEDLALENQVFPNPAGEQINLRLAESADWVQILDLSGKVLRQVSAPALEVSFDVSELPAGLYLIKAQTQNGQSYTQKWIKE